MEQSIFAKKSVMDAPSSAGDVIGVELQLYKNPNNALLEIHGKK